MSKLKPDAPFFAIGDIHGCADQLEKMLAQIESAADGSEVWVFLGDYLDRGRQSRQVLSRLYDLDRAQPDSIICLMGNHEQMMLDFIDDPADEGAKWLQHGGLETLASFGITPNPLDMDASALVDVANHLEAALPPGMQQWLRQLPLRWSNGNLHCVHAAMSPKRSVQDQRPHTLLWGHPQFLTSPRDDENFVVHGHTIVKQAGVFANRIALDTGAFRTGRLSAARFSTGVCQFFEVQ